MSALIILVVDDSPVTQETFRGFFSELGCDVKEAASAEEALANLKSGLMPDLIVLDFKLPGMSGPEFFKQINIDPRWKNIPVVPFSSQWTQGGSTFSKEWMEAHRHALAKNLARNVSNPVAKPKGEDAQSFPPEFFHAVIGALKSGPKPPPPLLQGAINYFLSAYPPRS